VEEAGGFEGHELGVGPGWGTLSAIYQGGRTKNSYLATPGRGINGRDIPLTEAPIEDKDFEP
jgi:hypothetical protein